MITVALYDNRQICKHCGEPIEMVSITTIWQANIDYHTVEIRNINNQLCLAIDGTIKMKYYDKPEQWIGVSSGKVIRINWSGLFGLYGEYRLKSGKLE